MPHPLDHNFVLNIQTMGDCNPTDVLRLSLLHLKSTLHSLKDDFEAEIIRYRKMELDFEDQPIY
jgi:DNA-directed RNA polymerase subunit L